MSAVGVVGEASEHDTGRPDSHDEVRTDEIRKAGKYDRATIRRNRRGLAE